MKTVIMAGGFGTRLRPLTANTPKPMVPLANRPMMHHIVNLLKRHGLTDLISSLFFFPDAITSYFGDGSRFGVLGIAKGSIQAGSGQPGPRREYGPGMDALRSPKMPVKNPHHVGCGIHSILL